MTQRASIQGVFILSPGGQILPVGEFERSCTRLFVFLDVANLQRPIRVRDQVRSLSFPRHSPLEDFWYKLPHILGSSNADLAPP